MNEESEVQGLFLSIVICNEENGLNVFHEVTHTQDAGNQGKSVLFPARYNVMFLMTVEHEVTQDYLSLDQHLNVKLLLENFLEEVGLLRSIESLEIILSFQNEW